MTQDPIDYAKELIDGFMPFIFQGEWSKNYNEPDCDNAKSCAIYHCGDILKTIFRIEYYDFPSDYNETDRRQIEFIQQTIQAINNL
jgi:hypothetical protein